MSLDRYIAGPGGAMAWLAPHIAPDPDAVELAAGTLLVGARTYRGDDPNAEGDFGGAWSGPTIVVTHHPDPEDAGRDLRRVGEVGLDLARAAARDRAVKVFGRRRASRSGRSTRSWSGVGARRAHDLPEVVFGELMGRIRLAPVRFPTVGDGVTKSLPVLDDVFTEEFFADPHAVYSRLRATGPVHHVETPNRQRVWLVIGHAEARKAFADPRFSKDAAVAQKVYERHTDPSVRDRDFAQSLSAHMLNTDPPEHTRLRKLVSSAFTPRRVEQLRPLIQQTAAELLHSLAQRLGRGETVDLLDALAIPLPTTVICELLGIPEPARDMLRAAIADLLSIGNPTRIDAASQTLAGLLMQTLEQRKNSPGDDLLTGLMTAQEGGDRLTSRELVSMAMLLLVAGHETTVNVIANGTLALIRNPQAAAAVRADRSLVPGLVEEILRFDGPTNTATFRFTTEVVDLGGVAVPAEHPVVVSPLAANRDPARYDDPDEFRPDRDTAGHLGFGHGVHHCLGAALGRLESAIVFDALFDQLPELALAGDGSLRYRRSILVRGLEALPVVSAGSR
jgi:cytochrome P450